MRYCSYKNCKNSSRNGHKMCHFPKNPSRRKIWIENSGLETAPTEYSTLCDMHFATDSWKVNKGGNIRIKKSAIPTIFTACEPELQNQEPKAQAKPSPWREKCEKQEISLDRGIQEPLCSTQVSNSGRNKQRRLRPSIILRSNKKKCLEIKPDLDNEHAEEPPCSKRVADSEKVQLRQSTQYSILRTIKKPLVQDTVDLVHEESFKEVSSRHLSETSNSNLQSKQIRQSTVQKGASTGIRALNQNDYSDEDLAQEEKDLSNLHEQFLNSSSITDLNVEEGLQKKCEDLQEKYNRVSKLYLKSERLRIIMKKRHKQKHRAFKEKVKKLKEQVRIAEKNPVGIRKILN
ncbi:uncharacterized protein LOC117174318 isoform X3 [Belonocnema kinseyi]|uniref:uncharacterized protein LOC117174318 isoform X3 n=1 Tax=Belonocnema kinseyi TaxID=2817044 RepID=UPI00143D8EBF|nr:uncharacterized protein LOC117174318 isoform X3 [Belonocnema kinseyi]